MGLVDYISRQANLVAPNITQYDKQFIVAKLDLMKRAPKKFLIKKSNFKRNSPKLQVSCQSHFRANSNELITPQIAQHIKNSIHTADINCANTNSTNSSKKAGDSSKNFNKFIPPICQP